ncbi:NAD(P)H-dependent oxidoreductase [Lactococcus lactis]|uniref:NAD(P)H-dependent oxidoreductase n=1 Tax=Lactococcus lactis TaxID=1358 RepID=A0AAP3Z3H7_9LACT|nr:NAD(P)H-dependent oxidoreductase [Lactococcus lactis]MDG4969826.1 NAD(P)H-dependent oxidoreductase [Lactococcus lactis]MDG4977618.1 NAD(P)H-dependent oxidoreductase [Lactococcus lactis]MDG5103644.1 NAD(P)H-dependent oxidoreductase [Lactococcus lactis]
MNQEQLRNMILNVHKNRFATKKFDPTQSIDEKDWNTIIESARLSPSSFGYEPWKFLIIDNNKIKEDLKPIAWGAVNSLEGANKFVIALARKNIVYNSDHVKHIVQDVLGLSYSESSPQSLFFKKFQENDFKLTDGKSLFNWTVKQTYIPLANMMTTASFLGIDSCPIEGFNIDEVESYLSKKGLIDLEKFGVAYMAGFGYRDQELPAKKRQPLQDIYTVID